MPPIPAPCYLCGGGDFRQRAGVVRDRPDLTVLECAGCGLVTLSSRDHIRPGHYESSGMHGDSGRSIDAWRRMGAADDRRRAETLAPLVMNRSVLDFGCGAGGFLIRIKPIAAVVCGVEPERRARDEWSDADVRIAASLDGAPGRFEVITAFHVVEHLPDPRASLAELASRLAPGGRLVVEVPSSDDALLTLYECDAFQRFTYWSQHLFLFNSETLLRVAAQAGLRAMAIEQVQRYPLSNHLHWLSAGRPGGHERWSFLDSPALAEAYRAALAAIGRCDTIVAHLQPASADS